MAWRRGRWPRCLRRWPASLAQRAATPSPPSTAERFELAQVLEEPSRRRERLRAHVLAVRERDLD